MSEPRATAAFGGGCHWCTEAVFQHVDGVTRVEQGFAASAPPDDALSEAALVTWDERAVGLGELIGVHLDTHAAGSDHALRAKYRSAVYVMSDRQGEAARRFLAAEAALRGPLVTRVMPLVRFEPSPERYRDYYRRRPDAPFCRTHIAPKLARMGRGPAAASARPGPAPLIDESVTVPPVRKADRSV